MGRKSIVVRFFIKNALKITYFNDGHSFKHFEKSRFFGPRISIFPQNWALKP